jgi:hypothetical protein
MTITLNSDYDVTLSTALLGYVGETNARHVSVEGMEVDGADRYVLTIDYGDGTAYEVDITGGQWTPTADILRSAQTVSCQIAAKKLSGQEYILVKKSRIFRLRIGAAIGDNAVPSPDVAMDALDRIDAIGRQAHADMQKAKSAADTATTAAENAEKSATTAGVSADTATQAASRAETAKTSAETSATQADTAKQGAETAAQTAQSVADSLPDDYTTAVEKIAENTVEISAVKLTDKELQRRVNALYDMGNGVTHQFETYSDTAYQKAVPTGAKLMSVKNIGGRSIVWNQLVKTNTDFSNTITDTRTFFMLKLMTFDSNGTVKEQKILIWDSNEIKSVKNSFIFKITADGNTVSIRHNGEKQDIRIYENATTQTIANHTYYLSINIKSADPSTVGGLQCNNLMLIDLTQMFGSGNEPTSVEEFEKMFPADYYPYNAGELMSMSVNNVVEQGKNLFDCYGFSCIAILNVNGERKLNNSYGTTISTIEPTNKIVVTQSQAPESVIAHVNNGWFCVGIKGMEQSKRYTFSFDFTTTKMLIQNPVLQILVNGRFPGGAINISELNVKKRVSFTLEYTKVDDRQYIELRLSGMSGIFENFQLDEGSTATAYTPYYTPISYTIPQAIQNLDGYGWSAGTARNYVDYENKRYVQCVQSVNLGTLTWARDSSANRWYNGNLPRFLSDKNAMCSQLSYIDNADNLQNGQWGHSGSGYFEVYVADATTSADVAKKMSGVILYYKLATPIITDISTLIDDDFLRNLTVEAGGSITFKNSNDNYHIPVPSEEEYIVKLSEIGGNV